MRLVLIAVSSLAIATVGSAQEVQPTLTQAGYTGLGVTPNARLLSWGNAGFSYDNQILGNVKDPSGHNYVLGFGLLPNLEISGRLAANSPQDSNCFVAPGCGVRDLSANFKAAIGLDPRGRYRVALGTADIGGSVTYFRTYYGVGTFNDGPWEASLGYGRRSDKGIGDSRSPLHGPFGSAAWQPLPVLRAQIEYADRKAWAGVRLFAPAQWLPQGWSAFIGANQSLIPTRLTERHWVSAGISIPLYHVPSLARAARAEPPTSVAAAQPQQPSPQQPSPQQPSSSPAPATRPIVDNAALRGLADSLIARGLEDIWVGRMPDDSIAVRANNASYNWNSLDALGAALGAIAHDLADTRAAYRLVLTQRQLPLVAVTGQSDCLRQWIDNASPGCTAGELSTPGTTALDRLHEGVAWVVQHDKPSWQTLRVSISPVLRTTVGSELAVFDYSLGANVGVQLPLWSGASVEARRDLPVANSTNYGGNQAFANRRVRSRMERVAFTQTVRIPLERWLDSDDVSTRRWGLANVAGQASMGRFGGDFDGIHGALRWEPAEGRHRASAEAGWFRNANFGAIGSPGPRNAKPLLASYRYDYTPTRTYFEASAGNFMNNDLGVQLGMRQWFNDVAVQVYYKRSRFENSPPRQFIGLQLSVPIGPRRDFAPAPHIEVTGTPRFAHGTETSVRESGSNPLRLGHGQLPPVNPIEATFNSDRAALVFFEDNLQRIREAAR